MDNYEQGDLIGEGSFGKVYRGLKRDTGETVALKVIPKICGNEKELRELREECNIQSALKHRNIIHMITSFEIEAALIVVTECAEYSLFALLLKEGTFPVERVRVIACHLCSAMYYLHSCRILHRDLKPQNVLIGKDRIAKLCDFGFARSMDIRTYLLTSVKGTPLYMAPELIDQKPYDHKADLWSLGCILYELMVGTPPFSTASVFHLTVKIRTEPVIWHNHITGDCLSFLKGLLEKNPERRLSWPNLLDHPFVAVPGELCVDRTEGEFSLTKVLSPSQELKKEEQRQDMQRKLEYNKKMYKRSKRKYLLTQQELHRYSNERRTPDLNTIGSPSSNLVLVNNCTARQPVIPTKLPVPATATPNYTGAATQTLDPLPLQNPIELLPGSNPDRTSPTGWREPKSNDSSGSSCETLTSSSEYDSESEDEDRGTVVGDGRLSKESLPGTDEESKVAKSNQHEKSNNVWKSGALFTLHSFGSEDKPIESDEWVDFLLKTMKEVIQTPKALCEKHFLTVIVAPLRNHLASPIVIEKIASLLSLPFTLEDKKDADLMQSLENIYMDTKVVPNLLYSCRLTVRRRRLEDDSIDLQRIASILTEEDLEGMDKSLRLVCFLVHSEEDFVIQFCNSIYVLEVFVILQLFLKLDKRKSRLATDTLGILCHVMRTSPTNVNILEDLFLARELQDSELWRLLMHTNPLILSRILRILGYLVIHSERARAQVVQNNKVWRLLRTSSSHAEAEVRAAAAFAVENIRWLGESSVNKSTSQANSTLPL